MTPKDYVMLAECLKAALILARTTTQPQYGSGQRAVETAAVFIASGLGRDNSRFDRDRFLIAAVGVQS